MSNSRQPLEAETEAILTGLIALTEGAQPESAAALGFGVDVTLMGLGALFVTYSAWQLSRMRRHRGRSGWQQLLRAMPYLVPVVFVVGLPWWLTAVAGGREVSWQLIGHLMPTLVAVAVVAAAAGVSVVAGRFAAWRMDRRKTQPR